MTDTETRPTAARTRPGARKAFVVLVELLAVAVVVQFYFAAFAVFTAPENDSQFVLHLVNGRAVLPLLCLLVIGAAALARAPGRLVGFSALPLGLLVGQMLLFLVAAATGSTPERTNVAGQVVLGLHAVNGLAILTVTLLLLRRARALARS
ncbi:DUF6220 domain-containing protein [Blastococcus sp. SYSU D00669]